MEDLQARHRREQKDLQARVTQKKKNATKKTRKGVNDECERLERELKERQQTEINTLSGIPLEQDLGRLGIDDPVVTGNGSVPQENVGHVDGFQDGGQKVSFSVPTKQEPQDESEQPQRGKKPSRQKARMARRAAEQEAQTAAATEEAANQPDLREREMAAMDEHKKRLGLTETVIRPDGHCLFSACAKGLSANAVKESGPFTEGFQNVRYATANYMSNHRDDFEAFLEEPFDSYVKKIKDTAEWGGQLELQAIAKSFHVSINVLQASGRVEKFEPEKIESKDNEVWLAYYRHSFGLGEHYNALAKG